jgi:hypothetical protein
VSRLIVLSELSIPLRWPAGTELADTVDCGPTETSVPTPRRTNSGICTGVHFSWKRSISLFTCSRLVPRAGSVVCDLSGLSVHCTFLGLNPLAKLIVSFST